MRIGWSWIAVVAVLVLAGAGSLVLWPDLWVIGSILIFFGAVLLLASARFVRRSPASKAEKWIPIADACALVVASVGDRIERFPGSHRVIAVLKLRQAASEGKLTIQGRRQSDSLNPGGGVASVWTDIPKEYWQTHHISPSAYIGQAAPPNGIETEKEGGWSASINRPFMVNYESRSIVSWSFGGSSPRSRPDGSTPCTPRANSPRKVLVVLKRSCRS